MHVNDDVEWGSMNFPKINKVAALKETPTLSNQNEEFVIASDFLFFSKLAIKMESCQAIFSNFILVTLPLFFHCIILMKVMQSRSGKHKCVFASAKFDLDCQTLLWHQLHEPMQWHRCAGPRQAKMAGGNGRNKRKWVLNKTKCLASKTEVFKDVGGK